MNTVSSKVLDFSLVQVTEVKNSNVMELEGLKRCLAHLQPEQVTVAKLATDRHMQVIVHMKKRGRTSNTTSIFGIKQSLFRRSYPKRLNQSHVQD